MLIGLITTDDAGLAGNVSLTVFVLFVATLKAPAGYVAAPGFVIPLILSDAGVLAPS